MERKLTIGNAIAFLESGLPVEQIVTARQLHSHDQLLLRELEGHLHTLQQMQSFNELAQKIKDSHCNPDLPLLQREPGLLLLFTMQTQQHPDFDSLSQHFIHHLNSCFWCFEIYSQTIQEYFVASQNLL